MSDTAKEYATNNPLGGVARMFETMAERIRAGERYDSVLTDYGLRHVEKGEFICAKCGLRQDAKTEKPEF